MDGKSIVEITIIMITLKNDEASKQIEAIRSVIAFLGEDKETYIECLTESVKIKENATIHLLSILESHVLPLMNHGLSVVSVAKIAESVCEEITTQCAMMELYAHYLAMATRNDDVEQRYSSISKRITENVNRLLYDIRQKVLQAIYYPEMMEFAEGADLVANLKK